MTTLKRGQRFPFPEVPDWFENLPARFAMPTMGELYTVRIEDYTENGRYVVRAELPGTSPENIDVFISDGVLTVQAERTEKEVDKNHSEIRYGVMSRSVTLPSGADEDDVTADYTNGMLTVSVGMGAEKPSAKHVEIKHGG
ncbi:Hsp20/alpha crystallin family protein [Streptomyces sp. NBC_00257]|uniref:Hsp20/alpha crystallin family protein n=1 Tax=unclassified Streptomyces TaxID=2593676 RepID=UPI000F5BE117|nr:MULTISPECIES: Hsp20/alpha crystallin family protein [unclassified Streptomyces]WSG55406.1 Hsp20/alpha crystallin family protein [Streptomyces sp. NBC_01732]WSX06544.1 Hsp20/alpha crystallin family protein [Streptomyces sp. NBC_00987]WTB58827.1 Hsp20/alpha crystallin family protein [Streptomyces sp. NBC_00826]WTH88296.1 Hsp20/alpha crystallin family protein [Streptomyces sp. NBC_00825]WTH97024.1 Hsp20/alpha crystallin family protein [Streptomyces sp. NBC_00822]